MSFRDRVLNQFLGVDPSKALNTRQGQAINGGDRPSLAAELKKSLNIIKGTAIFKNGQEVDYQAVRSSALYREFRMQVDQLADFDYFNLSTREDKLAFWINLYNSLVIDAVIQQEIQKSVTESWLGIMAFFQRAAYWINGQRFSLEDIEHGVLRGNRGFPYLPGTQFSAADPRQAAVIHPMDPRIHFSLNCASKSCPPIGFYSPGKINDQLDLAARNFINQDLELDHKQKSIKISRIFSWYRKDFGGNAGVISLIKDYVEDSSQAAWIEKNSHLIRIRYHPYDWRINNYKD